MSAAQVESVVTSVESLLADSALVQLQCRDRCARLAAAAERLRDDMEELREECESTQLGMARMRRQLQELHDSKAIYEARERQSRKLSKQL